MNPLITVDQAKSDARLLRMQLRAQGQPASHGNCLEMVAHSHGYKDWNALRAVLVRKLAVDWMVGGRIQGLYRRHAFTATIASVNKVGRDCFHVKIRLDKAIDVVSFASFSNFRKTICTVVDASGASLEKDSTGQSQLRISVWR